MGWKIKGRPPELKKFLIIVAPHTSNWDFIIGLFVRRILKFRSSYLAKSQLFKWPFGTLFRKLGGYPVDRSGKRNMVDQVTELYNTHETFVLAITPEGTRKNVARWKTGFYYIASRAEIPLVLVSIDYKKKQVTFHDAYQLSGDVNTDTDYINSIYQNIEGKNRRAAPFILEKKTE